jgi:uncharacterized membrane-anchored protein
MIKWLHFLLIIVILIILNSLVYSKEKILANGTTFYMPLAPRDPRSLMQGDYMRLRFDIDTELSKACNKSETKKGSGKFVVKISSDKTGDFKRLYKGTKLANGERIMRFLSKGRGGATFCFMTPNSFFFQEGLARYYSVARFGVFKAVGSEPGVLVGLADPKRILLKPKIKKESSPTFR